MPSPPAGVLAHQDIRSLCLTPKGRTSKNSLIKPCNPESIRTASYDLRLGPDYYFHPSGKASEVKISQLSATQRTIIVPPNQLVYVSMLEQLDFTDDIIGHLSLKVDLLFRGLFMASQSQIDAGYQGSIFALLYNLAACPVNLTLDSAILRLEFVRLPHATDMPYRKKYRGADLAKVLTEPVQSSLVELREQVDKARKNIRETSIEIDTAKRELESQDTKIKQWGMGLGLLLALVPVALSWWGPIDNRFDSLEAEIAKQQAVRQLGPRMDSLEASLRAVSATIGAAADSAAPPGATASGPVNARSAAADEEGLP